MPTQDPLETPDQPRPTRPTRPGRPHARRWLDVLATVLLLVALGVLVALARFWGGLAGMVADECASGSTCGSGIGLGADVGHHGPLVWWVVALVVSMIRLLRRRTAWWVPVAAAPLVLLTVVAAWWVSLSAAP